MNSLCTSENGMFEVVVNELVIHPSGVVDSTDMALPSSASFQTGRLLSCANKLKRYDVSFNS